VDTHRAEEREALAERIADRLDVPFTAAGVVFLLLVLAETVSSPQGAVGTVFAVASWALWAVFVGEFVLRMVIAPSTGRFLRRNWWQLAFLAIPALRFLRALRVLRAARVGRVLSAAVRSSRTAGRKLTNRLATLGVVTLVIVLASSQLVFELGGRDTYADALHASVLATVAGEPLLVDHAALRVLEVVLLAYSVAVFATLAGAVGAFLLERGSEDRRRLGEAGEPVADLSGADAGG
jgi:voltage-gated potassium channel